MDKSPQMCWTIIGASISWHLVLNSIWSKEVQYFYENVKLFYSNGTENIQNRQKYSYSVRYTRSFSGKCCWIVKHPHIAGVINRKRTKWDAELRAWTAKLRNSIKSEYQYLLSTQITCYIVKFLPGMSHNRAICGGNMLNI